MKKISLEVYHFAGSLRIIATFLLRVEDPIKVFLPIKAIVDTGSPITLISSTDLQRMRISKLQLQNIPVKNNPVNIGGGQIFTKEIEKTKIKFGNDIEVEMPINFPVKGEGSQPSLLGIDFMLKTKSKLIFNPSKKEAYFEIED
jgi:hypothetical protein